MEKSIKSPIKRMRRLRQWQWLRDLCQTNNISCHDLILPIFISDSTIGQNIEAMPGILRFNITQALDVVKQAADLGIPAVAPFAFVDLDKRDESGQAALAKNNIISQFCEAVKKCNLNIGIITDPALDPFTSHGHDGILRDGVIVNDESVQQIAKVALLHAQSGADIIAPSDMMDGRILAIRNILDEHGFTQTPILSYAAKFASAFYGPYREAVGTDKTLKGDKATYYLHTANASQAMQEIKIDIEEGADMVMVKPAMPYLDIICKAHRQFSVPIFAYQTSGEYAALEAAGKNGWLDREKAIFESLLSIKRAGAKGIFTYYALEVAKILCEN